MSTNLSTTGWAPGATVGAYLAVAQEPQRTRNEPPRGTTTISAAADAGGRVLHSVPDNTTMALYGTRADGAARWVMSGGKAGS